jgi:hypothetical protein
MMQFLPSSWEIFNVVPGATPFDPGPAVLAAANHLLHSGRLPGGGWDPARGLFGYNHSQDYVDLVLLTAAGYGWTYAADRPLPTPGRGTHPLPTNDGTHPLRVAKHVVAAALIAPTGSAVLVCLRSQVLAMTLPTSSTFGRVVLRAEDGWRFTYDGLGTVSPTSHVGAILDPGAALGTLAARPRGTQGGILRLAITRTGSLTVGVDPRPQLEAWTAPPVAAATTSPAVAAQ